MIKILVIATLTLLPALVFSQSGQQKIEEVVQQIKSTDRSPTDEQQAAFTYVFQNYAREPENTPASIQNALQVYLETVADSRDTGERNLTRDPKELPLKIALSHTSRNPEVIGKLVLRKDLSLSVRLQALGELKSDVAVTSVGKTLMKRTDAEGRYLAAMAFTSLENYSPEAARFLVEEFTSGRISRVHVIFESDRAQVRKLYKNLDATGRAKLSDYVRLKGSSINLEE